MQYNIFKIEEKKKLLDEITDKGYTTNGKILKSGNFSMKLYYNKKESASISWQRILNDFGLNISIEKESLKGILIAESKTETYAITYGMSSSLVQKYCDSDFPMEIAKRVEVSKVKRKASKILNGSTNSLIKTLTNSNVIVIDKGESVVNLELIPDENENLGKLIGIGKSVRVNLDKDIEQFSEIVLSLNDINSRTTKRTIPLLIKLKNDDLICEIWDYLNSDFFKNIENPEFSLSDINILGSSIYFNDNFRLELCFKNYKEEIPFLSTHYVSEFISKYNINPEEIYDYLKIKYISDDGGSFIKSFKQIVTYDFEYKNAKYVIYDGDIYYYNDDFLNDIVDGLNYIEFKKYNHEDDKSTLWYREYLDANGLVDVRDKEKNGKKAIYREQAINMILSEKYGFDNLDRNLVKICEGENYKIEIADLAREKDILYAVKVGNPRDFCYAIDQSNLVLDAFIANSNNKEELIEKYKDVKEIGLWFYVTGKNKFFDENGNINILSFDSIMFLNKLVEWCNKVIASNRKPIVRINYYETN